MTYDVRTERLHFIPEQASPDPQTARLRDLIALIDQALTEAYHTAREAKRQHERTAA